MVLLNFFVALLLVDACSTGSATEIGQQLQRPQDWYQPQTDPATIHRRQTPIVIAPPRTPLIPQPTSSLNYWWSYGSNGVNPTATSAAVLPSSISEVDETDTMDEVTTEVGSSSAPTTPTITTTSSSSLSSRSSPSQFSATSETTTSEASAVPTGNIIETPDSKDRTFKITSLLPLFIITGVLFVATLTGWMYGRCAFWCRRRREPVPGGPNIGGHPYESGLNDSGPTSPMRSLGVGWVDASRVYSRDSLVRQDYHVVQIDHPNEPNGTSSNSKYYAQDSPTWFRYTTSGGNHPLRPQNGHAGYTPPLTHHRVYAEASARDLSGGSSYTPSWKSQSPRHLRVVNASPSTLADGTGVRSPATGAHPTPHLSASRHASIRRKILKNARTSSEEDLLATTPPVGAFRGFHDEEEVAEEDWAVFNGNPKKLRPTPRYPSESLNSRSPAWSRGPEVHRSRMHRLRTAAQSAQPGAVPMSNTSNSVDVMHPLPPTPEVLLSPPLQPHLFFTSSSRASDETISSPKGTISFGRSKVSRNLNRQPGESSLTQSDPFGPCVPITTGASRRQKGKARPQRPMESTETLPLSPELRGAAMTRLDEIMKTSWSTRNLAGAPQSPTLYGALSPALRYHGNSGIEELLTNRSGGRG